MSDITRGQQKRASKGSGCFGVVIKLIGILVLIGIILCVGGYYAIFHTPLLLKWIKPIIESSSGVKIEGLTGSISSGFHVNRLMIKAKDDRWSSLEQVDLKFNRITDLLSNHRFVINRFSVGSGTIYHSSSNDINQPTERSKFTDNLGGSAIQNTGSISDHNEPLWEFKITELLVSNLKVINIDTNIESKLDKLSIMNFHYKNGELKTLDEFQIVGLTIHTKKFELVNFSGSTSNGLHVERFRSQDSYGNWSHLDEIKFQFNGFKDLLENKRLLITRLSVGPGGELYIPWNDDNTQDSNQLEEKDTPTDSATSKEESKPFEEFRLDLLMVTDLKLINPETGIEFQIDEISVRDFQYSEGQVQKLIDIVVKAGDINFKTAGSDYFIDQPPDSVQQQFSGVLRSSIHEDVLADISFDIHASFLPNGQMLLFANLFDEKLTYTINADQDLTVTFKQFSPSNYVRWKHGHLPTNLTGELRVKHASAEDKELKSLITVSPKSYFQLGRSTFYIENPDFPFKESKGNKLTITAKNQASNREYLCRLHILEEEPYLNIDIESSSGDERNTPDLLAKVFYNKTYKQLPERQKQSITKIIHNAQAPSSEIKTAAQRLTVVERKEIWSDLSRRWSQIQHDYANNDKAKKEAIETTRDHLLDKYNITLEQLKEIQDEGRTKNWPI